MKEKTVIAIAIAIIVPIIIGVLVGCAMPSGYDTEAELPTDTNIKESPEIACVYNSTIYTTARCVDTKYKVVCYKADSALRCFTYAELGL